MYKRAGVLFSTVILLTVVLVSSALSATPALVDVTLLNLRSGPGTAFSVIHTLPSQTPLTVLSQNQEWAQVKTATGLAGWVYGQYIAVDPAFQENIAQVQVMVSKLNFRQGPDVSYPVLAILLEGQLLQVSGETPFWYQVKIGGQTGFVHKDYVALVTDISPPQKPVSLPLARTTVTALNMRTGQGLQFPVATVLSQGTLVAVLNDGTWARVMLENGFIGFVSSEYIAPTEGQALAIIKAAEVNQRTGPGTEYEVVTTVSLGQTLPCTGWDGSWAKVASEAGEGYIQSSLLSLSFSMGDNGPLPDNLSTSRLDGFRVVVDAGHGGRDPGAIGINGLYEKNVNLTMALKLTALLRQAGAEVILTRETDVYLTLDERVAIVNASRADLSVSIHNNAHPSSFVSGTQTFYGDVAGSFNLGNAVHRNLVGIGLVDRKLLTANFKMIKLTNIPSVLTETAFLSNREDATKLSQDSFLDKAVQAHFIGIRDWLLKNGN